ncbi:MAG: UDP-N-acetylglucosamine 2-epimerase (non-hydrolyzing) [Acidimicrobiia bacterium]|nr:UDP-N-acetylglucosamine 2-epimerase (non-hydrolyzing) [Acidimicrobiia bacterium]MBT8249003.1 UDP-N-acetylglucosamine 2-epimerase (non-hydrolyzing) [Acidimicrobiia bacterium]NNC43179.1 UDP-N-acetylglucosamine 2-epimerase (non-hydrolyzing) [Acidimicrobiia bacterium]NND12740.1 UDP-N-acetylglucosamine 2-epimerase (non-hydrolyzing) [Acidimicrobiia bacterium]NNL27175.1 UDP-N-acetylglucosamine 2-epimerase (non-hydrolyzing) [Acidimicrobiia bacterium]
MENQPRRGSIAVALGTRPEIVKLAPIIELLGARARIIHTGQHYDPLMSEAFFKAFSLPPPDIHLEIGGRSRGRQIGEAVALIDQHLAEEPADAMIVQGDTNTVLAAAIAANANDIPVIHIEAGLRSFDRGMPEEHNRVLTDNIADLCCAPTTTSEENLIRSGISHERIVVTGNTVVESATRLLPPPEQRAEILKAFGVDQNRFVLATIHRPENVDDRDNLRIILDELGDLEMPVVFPIHPRTEQAVERFGFEALMRPLRVTQPLDYVDFLALFAESALAISDSGGVQEEASVLKRPVIVVRRSTERPEVNGTFAHLTRPGPAIGQLAGAIVGDLESVHARLATLASPYGDGTAAQKSIDALDALLEKVNDTG